ncbi:hypothetical protein SCATT_18560 [Streptantibioticus cattleyicolor NRRL 8057 = DSM 46488]|uniref:Uncharacterized protein n=1 Tax=Streptantibioticus cattleyicolor (strain ATCC 35852 / DSM 46488 / JCM 4925 / NBRC 14057 / NRRL 8057) TaxID=1003195 RepID=G8WRU3_STREN|nr:hypothetical protein SCATT_18560 [Streptantibioticus cattleyicolor NRRL 8057 = DSM 46488]
MIHRKVYYPEFPRECRSSARSATPHAGPVIAAHRRTA